MEGPGGVEQSPRAQPRWYGEQRLRDRQSIRTALLETQFSWGQDGGPLGRAAGRGEGEAEILSRGRSRGGAREELREGLAVLAIGEEVGDHGHGARAESQAHPAQPAPATTAAAAAGAGEERVNGGVRGEG